MALCKFNPAVLDVFTYLFKQREKQYPNRFSNLKTMLLNFNNSSPGIQLQKDLLGGSATQKMVGTGRVELPTSRLSVVRSNHLSYAPGTLVS